MDMSQEPFHARILTENATPQEQAKLAAQTLREPGKSKWTWACRKSSFMRKFTAKMTETRWSTLINTGLNPYHKNPTLLDFLAGFAQFVSVFSLLFES